MQSDKSDLKLPKDIINFAATGFFACNANCKTDCGRKRPSSELVEAIADLSYCCKDFVAATSEE